MLHLHSFLWNFLHSTNTYLFNLSRYMHFPIIVLIVHNFFFYLFLIFHIKCIHFTISLPLVSFIFTIRFSFCMVFSNEWMKMKMNTIIVEWNMKKKYKYIIVLQFHSVFDSFFYYLSYLHVSITFLSPIRSNTFFSISWFVNCNYVCALRGRVQHCSKTFPILSLYLPTIQKVKLLSSDGCLWQHNEIKST